MIANPVLGRKRWATLRKVRCAASQGALSTFLITLGTTGIRIVALPEAHMLQAHALKAMLLLILLLSVVLM